MPDSKWKDHAPPAREPSEPKSRKWSIAKRCLILAGALFVLIVVVSVIASECGNGVDAPSSPSVEEGKSQSTSDAFVRSDLRVQCAAVGSWPDGSPFEVVYLVDDDETIYPLNGNARDAFAGESGVRDVQSIQRGDRMRFNQAVNELIQVGLKLC